MSTLATQIEKLEILLANALTILNAFNDANFKDTAFAEVTIINPSGSTTTFNLPSNLALDRKVKALENTIEELTTLEGGTTLSVSIADPNVRELYISSFERAFGQILSSEFIVNTSLNIKQNSILDQLADPLSRIEVALPSDYSGVTQIRLLKYVLTASTKDTDYTNANVTSTDTKTSTLNKLISSKTPYKVYDDVINIDGVKVRYYGDFSVLSYNIDANGDLIATIDKNTFNDSESGALNSRELSIGDKLRTSNGRAIYEIVNINLVNGVKVTLRIKGGFDAIKTGISSLQYHDESDIIKNVHIPILGGERSFCFFAPINSKGISGEWSSAISVSSADYTVEVDGINVAFDEYFNTNVLPVSLYIKSQIADQGISRSLALDIPKPTLELGNFDVLQINTHLSKTADYDKIKRLQEEKNNTASKVDSLSSEIQEVQNRLSRAVYKSDLAKQQDTTLLEKKKSEVAIESKKLQTLIKEISTVSATSSAAKTSPKYRVRGFWKVDEPTDTNGTQRIVQYEIRYKYTPSNSSASVSQALSKINGQDGSFSPFTELTTKPLAKEYNAEKDKYEYEPNNISDATKNNINQLDIPITYGESVIVQVRAISEAGYPTNPQKSDWSDELRIEFPTSLAQEETISAIVSSNAEDEQILKLDTFLDQKGVNEHISDSFEVADQYFAHKTTSIDSGFKEDGIVLNLFKYLSNLNNRIAFLEETVLRQTVSWVIDIIDEDNRTYPISNNSTSTLFGGYYSDNVSDVDNVFGEIVTKTFYLRIKNSSARSGEILTLSGGDLTATTTDSNFNNAPVHALGGLSNQKNGQIIYLRDDSIDGSTNLFVSDTSTLQTQPTSSDIDGSALSAQQNVVSFDGSSFSEVALFSNASSTGYACMLDTHPTYLEYLTNTSDPTLISNLTAEFNRISNLGLDYRNQVYQKDFDSISGNFEDFKVDDIHLVGGDTCGSSVILEPQNYSSIQVPTADASKGTIVEGGNTILIPITFKYRMQDALGRPNGNGAVTNSTQFTYEKKVGFSLFLGSQIDFDLVFRARFRPSEISGITSSDSTPIDTNNNTNTFIL